VCPLAKRDHSQGSCWETRSSIMEGVLINPKRAVDGVPLTSEGRGIIAKEG
jgi:hypothetical protein